MEQFSALAQAIGARVGADLPPSNEDAAVLAAAHCFERRPRGSARLYASPKTALTTYLELLGSNPTEAGRYYAGNAGLIADDEAALVRARNAEARKPKR